MGGEPILGRVIETVEAGFQSLGQATARRLAQQSARKGRQWRTLLVYGPAGAGKTELAKAIAGATLTGRCPIMWTERVAMSTISEIR